MRVYDDPNQLRRKLVMVGEGNSGKTSMLMVLAGQPFPEEYVPTLFDSQIARIAVGGNKIVEMSLWDTAGQEEYDRLRPLSYPDTDVAIICFSVDTHELDTVIDKGLRIANQIGAAKYMECSAKTGEGIHEIFTVAAKLALKPRRRMNKCKLV
nr:GTP-binding protein Rho1 [Polyrhizophydium stewartii]